MKPTTTIFIIGTITTLLISAYPVFAPPGNSHPPNGHPPPHPQERTSKEQLQIEPNRLDWFQNRELMELYLFEKGLFDIPRTPTGDIDWDLLLSEHGAPPTPPPMNNDFALTEAEQLDQKAQKAEREARRLREEAAKDRNAASEQRARSPVAGRDAEAIRLAGC